MAWYYYSGRVTRPIRVCSTKSVAVRPNSKIEILEVTPDVQGLLRTGELRRTGRPLGAKSLEDQPPAPQVRMQDVLPKSQLAQHFAEKGVTTSSSMPPKRPKGVQEFTVHELAAAEPLPATSPVGENGNFAADHAEPVVDGFREDEGKNRWKKRHR